MGHNLLIALDGIYGMASAVVRGMRYQMVYTKGSTRIVVGTRATQQACVDYIQTQLYADQAVFVRIVKLAAKRSAV